MPENTFFSQKSSSIDNFPPTQAALVEHIKRAAYQEGHVWEQMWVAIPELSSPQEWEWEPNPNENWEVK